MRKLFKLAFRLFLLLLLLIGLLVLVRNPAMRLWTENVLRTETGMEAVLGKVIIQLGSPVVRIENLRLINPPQFGGVTFVDIPHLELEYDPFLLAFRRVQLERVTCNLVELHIVEDAQGSTNLQRIQKRLAERQLEDRLAEWDISFEGIEELVLSFDRFKYSSLKNPSHSNEIRLGVRQVTIKNIDSFRDLGVALGHVAARGSTNFAATLLLNAAGAAH